MGFSTRLQKTRTKLEEPCDCNYGLCNRFFNATENDFRCTDFSRKNVSAGSVKQERQKRLSERQLMEEQNKAKATEHPETLDGDNVDWTPSASLFKCFHVFHVIDVRCYVQDAEPKPVAPDNTAVPEPRCLMMFNAEAEFMWAILHGLCAVQCKVFVKSWNLDNSNFCHLSFAALAASLVHRHLWLQRSTRRRVAFAVSLFFDPVECVVEDWSLTMEFKNCILNQSECTL